MPWDSGWSRTSDPQWKHTVKRIRTRDNDICHVCYQPGATQVDHITPVAEGGTDNDNNLGCIHGTPCHRDKTQAEALRGRLRHSRARPTRQHPGII